jgi:hypothetical protein
MTDPFDALASVERRLDDLKKKQAARRGNHAYRDNLPRIAAEITRLSETRDMILAARSEKEKPDA